MERRMENLDKQLKRLEKHLHIIGEFYIDEVEQIRYIRKELEKIRKQYEELKKNNY